jgi:uncharacterized protein with LGFP repeats
MAGSWIDDRLWTAAQPQEFNGDSAIYKLWRQLRSEGTYLGVPITPEIQTPIGVQQAFASGAVLGWSNEQGAYVASDA